MDRSKEAGATGEALYLDVRDVYYDVANKPMIIGGRYGLGSKELYPSEVLAVFDNLAAAEPKNGFTVGIIDDVTGHSLPIPLRLLTPLLREPQAASSGA